jgi:hypothetical protein
MSTAHHLSTIDLDRSDGLGRKPDPITMKSVSASVKRRFDLSEKIVNRRKLDTPTAIAHKRTSLTNSDLNRKWLSIAANWTIQPHCPSAQQFCDERLNRSVHQRSDLTFPTEVTFFKRT